MKTLSKAVSKALSKSRRRNDSPVLPTYEQVKLEDLFGLSKGYLANGNLQLCYLCTTYYLETNHPSNDKKIRPVHHGIDRIAASLLALLEYTLEPRSLQVAKDFVLQNRSGDKFTSVLETFNGHKPPAKLMQIAMDPASFPILSGQVEAVLAEIQGQQPATTGGDNGAESWRHRVVVVDMRALRKRLQDKL